MFQRPNVVGFGLFMLACAVVPARASAQTTTQVAPYFLVIQDTSGSMTLSTESATSATLAANCAAHNSDATPATSCGADVANFCVWTGTPGQGSGCLSQRCGALHTAAGQAACVADTTNGCVWAATTATGSGLCTTRNSCGHAHTRMSDAKCALGDMLSAYGDAQFGLETYDTVCTAGSCLFAGTTCEQGDCGYTSCSLATCDATAASALMRVAISPTGGESAYNLIDYSCAGSTASVPTELFTAGNTPLGGSLVLARNYFISGATINGTTFPSPLAGDAFIGCRPVAVILLTDGLENCGGDAVAAATALRSTVVPSTGTVNIKTYVIGLGVNDPTTLNAIASAGGTSTAFNASDDASLASAFSQIIAASVRVEVCDGVDNNCNGLVDEGFPLYCNLPSHPARDLCTAPAETLCDGIDNNCNGTIDEFLLNACGTCGAAPTELCDRLDNDCDGIIDEGACTLGCTPTPEVCDNMDNNCNGTVDENVTRPCGIMIGICTTGVETCTAGTFGACSGIGPQPEVCDNLDNNCDGIIDGEIQPCGSSVGACRQGSQICIAGTFGSCIGALGPSPERCDNIDNDCDGLVDEGNPGGGGSCGSSIGICTPGMYVCVAGALTCQGGSSGTSEICNGVDDDCDGTVDEGIPSDGTCGASGVGACTLGNLLCVAGVPDVCVGAVGPTPEVCNNLDDDCDGLVDEGNPEGGVICGDDTGECMSGITTCTSGVLTCVGAVGPVPEICDMKDNDCNGVIDDGIPVGAPCGSSLGECTPGMFVCNPSTGMVECQGGTSGMAEICNNLDDDCDGITDEDSNPMPAVTCGVDVGLCMAGLRMCVGGALICVGETQPTPETCDCQDNDCDGTVDNPPTGGSLCPSGQECVMCQCASMCQHDEFGNHCPSGTTPYVDPGGVCSCVAPNCDATSCGAMTLMDTAGAVECAPGSTTVGACVCRNNECTFPCAGVTCTAPLICNPRTGACADPTCRGQGCPTGQICDTTSGNCMADPCLTAGCTATQECRAGVCESTCVGVTCTGTQVCHAGTCVPDMCAGVTCTGGRVCNPANGMCVTNLCIGVPCPTSQTCNPVTGTCVADPCSMLECPAGSSCMQGECIGVATDGGMPVDAGVDASVRIDSGMMGIDSGMPGTPDSGTHRVLAAGGVECGCTVVGERAGGTTGAAGLLVAAIGAAVMRRRRRKGGAR